jgi:LysR family nitrogen assimilation transcriptional regulator
MGNSDFRYRHLESRSPGDGSVRLRQFKYFISIVEHGSFTKAAERLFIAQSALSMQMKKLEDELGTALFIRNANGISLTPAGDAFLRHAHLVTAQVAACDREVRDMASDAPRGVVRIAIAVSLSRVLTIPLLHAVQTRYPGISLHVVEALTADMVKGLEAGTLDLAILFAWPAPEAQPRTAEDVLRQENLYLVSPRRGQARTGPPVDLAELTEIELVLPTTRYATRRFLAEESTRRGTQLPVRIELDSLQQTLSMIVAGEAHSIMSMSTFLEEWREGRVRVRTITGLTRSPHLCIRAGVAGTSRAAQMVRQLVHETARDLADNGQWPRSLDPEPEPIAAPSRKTRVRDVA